MATMENKPVFEEYLHRLSGQEKELDVISLDHSYSKPWTAHPDSHHARPAKLLFMKLRCQQPDISLSDDPIIDVEKVELSPPVPPYDNQKTRAMMNECDQFLQTSLDHEPEESELLNKNSWSQSQKSLYKQMMKILQSSRLSKLTFALSNKELVKRKIIIEKESRRTRKLFTSYAWDMVLLCWLHQTFMDSLSASMLSEYFEILRCLKTKVPNLIDRLLAKATSFHSGIFDTCSTEAFSQLLRKPWDPVLSGMTQNKPKKVACNPLIVVVPSAPNQTIANQNHRMKFIWNQLGSFGKVIHSTVHSSSVTAIGDCCDQIFTSTRAKVADLKNQYPSRPIVLAGWTIGALLACHIALEETVAAVICFGFPLKGVDGPRGISLDDPLLDCKVPTLLMIGQNSLLCSMDDMEDFREKMIAETGLVVVGGADDMLRVSVTKKKTEGITQSMVDRCLVDEVGDFLNSVISQPNSSGHLPSSSAIKKPNLTAAPTIQLNIPQMSQDNGEESKRQRRRPREYSPDFSPAKRKQKPTSTPQPTRKVSASSSSDTSSTGSYRPITGSYHRERASKRDRKKSSRKSRSSFGLGKKRRVAKIVRGGLKMKLKVNPPSNEEEEVNKHVENSTPPAKPLTPQKRVQSEPPPLASRASHLIIDEASTSTLHSSPERKKQPSPLNVPKSLSLANQQKSNGPVDVEKAFGKDSSFLPRPLTPAEMDQNELEQPKPDSSAPSDAPVSAPLETVLITDSASPEKKKLTFLTTSSSESFPLVSFSPSAVGSTTFTIPQVVATEPLLFQTGSAKTAQHVTAQLAPADVLAFSKSATTISQQQPQATILSSGGLTIKQLQNTITSLTGKSLIASSPVGVKTTKPQTIYVTPPNSKPTTFLMASSEVGPKKIQVRRMVMKPTSPASPSTSRLTVPLMAKLSSIPAAAGSPSTAAKSGAAQESSEPKTCNLSLLSDVAGMKEPIRQMSVNKEATFFQSSPGATLVKLTSDNFSATAADKRATTVTQPQVRRFRLIEALPPVASQSSSPHLDTPEEFAEKQRAIQALSSSLNNEATDEAPENRNITFAYRQPPAAIRPAGMRAPYSSYPVVMPRPRVAQILGTRIAYRGVGRARGNNPFGPTPRRPRIQRFYPF